MKTSLLFIAIAGLFSSMASAADLYVRDNGAGGSYPTISAAITAAADGDRIIIRPKAANLPYIENLTIDKSLSFVSETNYMRYVLQGTVSVTAAAGRTVTINNMSSASTIAISANTTNGRTTLNLFNSLFSAINAQKQNSSVNLSGCTISGVVSINHGRVTGNKFDSISITSTTLDDAAATDPIEIIANKMSETISVSQKTYAIRVLNNYCTGGGIYFYAAKTGSNNEIRNNVFNAGTYSAVTFNLGTTNPATFTVLNNILTTSTTLTNYAEVHNQNTATATVYAYNNLSASAFTTIGVISAADNLGGQSITFSNSTYTVTGTAVINNGNADDEYTDLDLTRNDVGNFGGSDSWANYWPANADNKPQVNYLNTPRRIYTGTTEMNATGAGHTK